MPPLPRAIQCLVRVTSVLIYTGLLGGIYPLLWVVPSASAECRLAILTLFCIDISATAIKIVILSALTLPHGSDMVQIAETVCA